MMGKVEGREVYRSPKTMKSPEWLNSKIVKSISLNYIKINKSKTKTIITLGI